MTARRHGRAAYQLLLVDVVAVLTQIRSAIETAGAANTEHRAPSAHSDLIVMGVQGRGGVELMLYGSNTQHVVRAAKCPVLTVRA